MALRDLLLFVILLGGIPVYLFNPYYGILAYHWIGIMNPHRFTWGAAYAFPFAKVVALSVLVGLFLGERNRLPRERETWLMGLLWVLFTVTTFFALRPDPAWAQWNKVSKVLLMTFVTMMLCCSRERLHALLTVVAFSIAFFGLKGGIFGILTGGQFRVWGPPESFIEDNNSMALAFNMTLPLLLYLARQYERRWLKRVTYALVPLVILASVLTFSRGGAITLVAVVLFCLVRSRRKALAVVLAVAVGAFVLYNVSDRFFNRMETVKAPTEDASFMGRVNAWKYGWNLALDRPLVGGGFENVSRETFLVYAPEPEKVHDFHNIYFEILGEHGFPALFVYLLIYYGLWFSLGRLRRVFRDDPDNGWMADLASALQISLFAYLMNGLTLGMSYFDMAWLMVGVGAMLKTLARETVTAGAVEEVVPRPSAAWQRGRPGLPQPLRKA